MAKRNYVVYCDESDKRGRYFSNFFGGVVLRAQDREVLDELLNEKKGELNLGNELKWQKVTENYLEKYADFIRYYFSFVATGRIKVRIMFSQNIHVPTGLTKEQVETAYFRLYYQFIKHAFRIRYCNPNAIDSVSFSLLLDQLPDKKEKNDHFKQHLSRIPNTADLRGLKINIDSSQIADVDSKDHVILQGLDIILGAMSFRLNDKHLEKPVGSRRRGKRTIAKERLYKIINQEIRSIYPNFNIGMNTGTQGSPSNRWKHPYRHWRFVPTKHDVDLDQGKRRAPQGPT